MLRRKILENCDSHSRGQNSCLTLCIHFMYSYTVGTQCLLSTVPSRPETQFCLEVFGTGMERLISVMFYLEMLPYKYMCYKEKLWKTSKQVTFVLKHLLLSQQFIQNLNFDLQDSEFSIHPSIHPINIFIQYLSCAKYWPALMMQAMNKTEKKALL